MNLELKREYLFRKQKGKRVLVEYMNELTALLDDDKGKFKILGLEESDEILRQSKERLNSQRSIKEKIKFEHKEHLLKERINKCNEKLPAKVFLFTEYSESCGLVLFDSLTMFNCDFKFSAEHAGLIVMISGNLCNKILLDFYEEKGNYILEIEMLGDVWGNIT